MQNRERAALEMIGWRKANCMTQNQFALAVGVAIRTIQGIELSEHGPSKSTYKLFCQLRDKFKRRNEIKEPRMTMRQRLERAAAEVDCE